MEDQGKRLILAVALAMGVFLAWSWLFPPEEPKPKQATPTETKPAPTGSPVGRAADAPVTAEAGAPPAAAAVPVVPPVERGPEQVLVLENGVVRATFSSHGGGLKSWQLLDKKYENDPTKGELVVQPGTDVAAYLGVNFVDSTYSIPAKAEWQGEKVSETQVRYRYTDAQIEVTKTFTFYPAQYLLRMVVETTAKAGEAKLRLAVSGFGFQDPAIEIKSGMGRTPREWQAACFIGEDDIAATSAKDLEGKPRERSGAVHWGGFIHPYMLSAIAPRNDARESLQCNQYPVVGARGFMQTDVVWPAATIKPGDAPLTREAVAYLGPKFYDKLTLSSETAGFETGFDGAVDLGWFAFIGRPLLWLLQQFFAWFANWGVAIIALTFLVKLATLYWTTKSMRSMQSMAELKPKIDELQKKYSDDRQRLQTEMMALYKTHGVNPVAGCLPILMQMPIWLALYKMLSAAGELYQARFIPGWIEDLTATDPYHILPIVLIAAMFGQAKLSPAAIDSTQQKILMYGMPLMFGVMGFFFPSGLSVYILTNTVLSAAHTLYMRKTKKTPTPPAAAVGVVSNKGGSDLADAAQGTDAAADKGDKGGAKGTPRGGRTAGRGKSRRR